MLNFMYTKYIVALATTVSLAGCGSAVAAENTEAATATSGGYTDAQIVVPDTGGDDATLRAASEEAAEVDRQLVVESGTSITITEAGTYRLSGQASDSTVIVDAADTDKVTLELCGLTIENSNFPAIYVRSADKVSVTLASGTENALSVTGAFVSDGDTACDGVIFSKDDLVLGGEGSLAVSSSKHAVVSKDDLKVKGGSYAIVASGKAFAANDTLTIEAGTIDLSASEGLEATVVSVEGGAVSIAATDDGINATAKSDKTDMGTPTVQISGGELIIEMAQGDTDAIDSNGNVYISGGTLEINAQSAFDVDGEATLTGGTVFVNGSQVTSIENSMMGAGRGGMGHASGVGGRMGGGFRG